MRPKSVSSRLVLTYLSLRGFNCAHGLTGREAQGRSASGRNGGARKTTSSNSVVMRIASNDFVLVHMQLVHSIRYFMTKRSSSQLAACGSVLFPLDWIARSQLETWSFLRYTSASLVAAFLHTVHGGAKPRACLTGLRV